MILFLVTHWWAWRWKVVRSLLSGHCTDTLAHWESLKVMELLSHLRVPTPSGYDERMETLGVGLDLCEIGRIERLLTKYPRFAERCFTEHEREYAHRFAMPSRRFAARFAGKEAVMKSMGTGYRRIRWQDIEITGGGAPTVRMTGTAAARATQLGVQVVRVSITHTDDTAMVIAMALGDGVED